MATTTTTNNAQCTASRRRAAPSSAIRNANATSNARTPAPGPAKCPLARIPSAVRFAGASACAGRDAERCIPRAATVPYGGGAMEAGTVVRLPIFPLGQVAMPSCTVPLNIFEARYRVLFNTLLAGDEGLDEELIQKDSPFHGSRTFGMCLVTKEGIRNIGTTLEIKQHTTIADGRLLVTNKGMQRFRILETVEESPVLICDVEMLEDEEETDEEKVNQLAEELADTFRGILQLTSKLSQTRPQPKAEVFEPEELSLLTPHDLSFWIPSQFGNFEGTKQELLEQLSVTNRLEAELGILTSSLQVLRAKTALKSAFTDDSSSSSEPPQSASPN